MEREISQIIGTGVINNLSFVSVCLMPTLDSARSPFYIIDRVELRTKYNNKQQIKILLI